MKLPARNSAPLAEQPLFFATPAEFRRWLAVHHGSARELWVGYHRKATGRPSMTWQESVDEALCFGWIDGIRKSVDAHSYKIRFTPRKAKSTWSAVNIARMEVLRKQDRLHPAGVAAFSRLKKSNSAIYSFENRKAAKLTAEQQRSFQPHRTAWNFFQAQPPGYRRMAAWWVISAKKPETRQSRLKRLIEDSLAERRIY
jgi:uncharacterized protein YdeI (YjbR/CyaY-like superfamily)